MPFTTQEFLEVFKNYNLAVFPAQIIFNVIAILILYLLLYKSKYSDKIINLSLGLLWLWIGVVYHYIFFTVINNAAYIFALLFIMQGLLFIYYGVIKEKITYDYVQNDNKVISLFIIIYALVLYPIIGLFSRHLYPYNPTFGLPCPTTIFTFGMLMFTYNFKLKFIIIPLLWSFLGISAAMNFGISEDIGLLISGLITLYYLWMRNFKIKKIKPGTI